MASQNNNCVQIELLTEDNYSTWKMQMEALLVKKKLWAYASGKELFSSMNDERKQIEWLKYDKEAKCEFILSISPSELKHIRNCETSHQIWNELHCVYESSDKAKKRSLLKQLVAYHSSIDTDMATHTIEFCNIVEKLNKMNVGIDEELLVIMFLQSLPRSYENFSYAIELQEKLPTLDLLKIKIIDDIKARSRKTKNESEEPRVNNDFDIEQPL